MIKLLAILTILGTAIGCATNSGVVETGPDSYMISREAGTGFSGIGSMKTDNIKEAGAYCKNSGKLLKITGTTENPSGLFGKYAHSDVQFMCLNQGDASLTRTVMVPVTPAPADKVMGH